MRCSPRSAFVSRPRATIKAAAKVGPGMRIRTPFERFERGTPTPPDTPRAFERTNAPGWGMGLPIDKYAEPTPSNFNRLPLGKCVPHDDGYGPTAGLDRLELAMHVRRRRSGRLEPQLHRLALVPHDGEQFAERTVRRHLASAQRPRDVTRRRAAEAEAPRARGHALSCCFDIVTTIPGDKHADRR